MKPTPTRSIIRPGHYFTVYLSEGYATLDALKAATVIPGTANKVAAWNGHEFEALEAHIRVANRNGYAEFGHLLQGGRNSEYQMEVFHPIDPRIVEADIAGAVHAYANDDGNGWLFGHTREGTHHDYELSLLGALAGVFQPLILQYRVDADSATASTAQRGRRIYGVLAAFYGSVVVEARKIARGTYLGEREQMAHPLEGWLDHDCTAAIDAVAAAWKKDTNRTAALVDLSVPLAYLRQALAMPSVETRWDRKKRLDDEAKAAAEQAPAGDSPAEGA